MLGIMPTAVISKVGVTGPRGDSLYRLSLPEMKGVRYAVAVS
jgi:hypothetical protein